MRKLSILSLLMALIIIGCSKPDNELLTKANAEMEAGNNDEAMVLYQKIIDEFPDTDGAPEAMFRLASLHRDYKNDPLKAATMYEDIFINYPKSQYAHRGLFLAGFIYNNDLGNSDRAEKAYKKYMEVFPDSTFADEADFELKNLGKTPDEILQAMRDTVKDDNTKSYEMGMEEYQ